MEHPRILFSGSLISFAVITATFACSDGQCKSENLKEKENTLREVRDCSGISLESVCERDNIMFYFLLYSNLGPLPTCFLHLSSASLEMNVRLMQTAKPGCLVFLVLQAFDGLRCIRSTTTNQFEFMVNLYLTVGCFSSPSFTYFTDIDIIFCEKNSLPFNRYAYLTTHNSFANEVEPLHTGIRLTFLNQETISQFPCVYFRFARLLEKETESPGFSLQWLAIDTLKEVEAFLSANPSEIVTLFLEDYVETPNGLSKVFKDAYWFPVSMPQNGQDWPLVKDMVASNKDLLSSLQPNGDVGEHPGQCSNRGESAPLDDETKSLFLINHFHSIAFKVMACEDNSASLISMLDTCYGRSGNRWANFVARSDGGGVFQAVDKLNGQLLCGCDDVHSCVGGTAITLVSLKVSKMVDLQLSIEDLKLAIWFGLYQ
ncbi:hypothetical protein CXB51_005697 [Gossypium anomalum]|uniref:Uncharacterized protein n=1 Tax=Gossypium anomalum TaxID=47600 RepID=A0A8J5Z2C3_9ROSI|nr:hypothetical protein CXB51_005697 [Gossypium anomalum]